MTKTDEPNKTITKILQNYFSTEWIQEHNSTYGEIVRDLVYLLASNQTNLIDEILESIKPEPLLYSTNTSPAKQNTTGKKITFRQEYADKEERVIRNEVRAEITKILENKKKEFQNG